MTVSCRKKVPVARFTLESLSLLVWLTHRGVEAIRFDADYVPGQLPLRSGQGQDVPELGGSAPDKLKAAISQRRVLYQIPEIDITQAVLARLDEEYRAKSR